MKEKIKIGVLIKNHKILLWEYRILEKLFNSEFAEITLLIISNENHIRINDKNYSLLYRFHEKLDKRIFKKNVDYEKKIDISNLLKGVPLITCNQAKENFREYSAVKPDTRLTDYNIDIILNLGLTSINNDLFKVPRYGIWSYKIGDNRIIRGIPPIYWEIVKKFPEIGCTVCMFKDDYANETIIYRTSLPTFTKSININKNRVYGLASLIMPRLIKGLCLSGSLFLDELRFKYNNDIEIYDSELYKSPTSLQALWNLIIIFTNSLYRNIIYQKKDFWFLLYKINESKKSFPAVINSYDTVVAPKDKYWADPFVITKDQNHYIFIEEFLFEKNKAHISVIKLNNKGNLLSSERIIEKPYHMSYPFVFEIDDKYYMVPESKGNKTIQLYCCTSFPDKWEFVMNLMENISAVDTTLFFYNKKWWLFTAVDTLNNPSIPYDELFLYFSDNLFSGHWKSHPMNPIITDVKTSRPAGKIFILNNKIFRPSQDCSGGYGKALNLNQITTLNESEYEEIPVLKVKPGWNKELNGTHTFNFNSNITVIDASLRKKRINLRRFK